MLQIKSISKRYKTGDFVQQALDKVSLNLRDSEFVAILGPSGSGKTTLLNIIGGLDRYDDGDLVINGISTRQYKDRDWDSYRNHTIGFVFQSYKSDPSPDDSVECRTRADDFRHRQGRPSRTCAQGAGEGRTRRTHQQEAKPAVRRPDAARGDRPRTGQRPGHRPGSTSRPARSIRTRPCRS